MSEENRSQERTLELEFLYTPLQFADEPVKKNILRLRPVDGDCRYYYRTIFFSCLTDFGFDILSALTAEGFLSYEPLSKRYQLGIELYLLAGSARQFSIRNQFRSALEQVAGETGDTVFLLIRSGNDALCIDRVEGKAPIRTVPVDVGARRPLGIGAGSMALTAFLPTDRVEAVIASNALRYSRFTKLGIDDIRDLAEKSRKTGFVVSEGIFHEGVTSIGIPILDGKGEVIAAVTVSSISQRMDGKRRAEIVRIVKRITRAERHLQE
ncbi:MAG: IclR family transcriptional regulator [Desulfobacteraceae bacterium]|nr:MAG: IclR family transcriptional regulator [Desulfobacteraceae bacterium]